MKFVANRINGIHLRDLLPTISEEIQVDYVLAAIAYGQNASDQTQDLVGHAISNKLRLDLWMRYDETVPVAIPLLKRLLKHQADNIFTKFVPDVFHPKIIWWKGYGAYIGSANHTDRGWLTNIEGGIFIAEDELINNDMDKELDNFFEYLRNIEKAIPISETYISEMEKLNDFNKDTYKKAKQNREHKEWSGPSFIPNKTAIDRRKDKFKEEWLNTLGILDSIQQHLEKHRPIWVQNSVPLGWQVDQFLHAYYYNRLSDTLHKPYEEQYIQNRKDPNAALMTELRWWQAQKIAPSREDETFYNHAPAIKKLLQKNKILTLTPDEFESVCSRTHATMDHVIKIPVSDLGRPDLKTMKRDERIAIFAKQLLGLHNKKGWNIRELLYYVLYDGPNEKLWERIYHAGRDTDYNIPRYGLNSISEVAGWAMPEVAPPRNGRTSKALRALGFDVKIY